MRVFTFIMMGSFPFLFVNVGLGRDTMRRPLILTRSGSALPTTAAG